MQTVIDAYELLGVDRAADQADIKAAYRKLSKKLHPDAPGGDAEAMAAVNAAYGVLKSPAKRAALDADLDYTRPVAAPTPQEAEAPFDWADDGHTPAEQALVPRRQGSTAGRRAASTVLLVVSALLLAPGVYAAVMHEQEASYQAFHTVTALSIAGLWAGYWRRGGLVFPAVAAGVVVMWLLLAQGPALAALWLAGGFVLLITWRRAA